MILLGLSSSSQAATAAILRDGELLCEYTQNQNKTQSVKMLPMIERMLKDVALTLSDVDVVVCDVGPGSFTGVRIGVATARGIADALGLDCVSVNSLACLYQNVAHFSGRVFSLIFAREDECFLAVYENGEEVVAPCVMTVSEIAKLANEKTAPCIFVGDGAVKNKPFFEQNVSGAVFATGRQNMILASSLLEAGAKKLETHGATTSEGLMPLYLRASQAEREYEARKKQANK